MSHVVIIGNGVAGITAARHIRKLSNKRITVVSSESEHFFSRTALMYIYMGHMRYEHTKPYENWFWDKNRIELVYDRVEKIDFQAKKLVLQKGKPLSWDQLIIATGSLPNKFGWAGQDLQGVQSLYSLQDLELLEKNTENCSGAVIIGCGLIGVELAEMLSSRKSPVTMLGREPYYMSNTLPDEEAMLVGQHIRQHNIELRLQTELKAILPDEKGRAASVLTSTGEQIPCSFVGLTAGVFPNIGFLKNSEIGTRRGVLVNEYLETTIPDVYAAGDCAEFINPKPFNPAVEQLWYTARMQGATLAKTICGERTAYDRGIWFNSAKFFGLEYQTYGIIANKLREGEGTFYWENPDKSQAFRVQFNQSDASVTGFNFLGIRYRQDVAEAFIRSKTPVETVLRNLSKGLFNPEFSSSPVPAILNAYVKQNAAKGAGFIQTSDMSL